MTVVNKKIKKGMTIVPDDVAITAEEGAIKVGDTSKELEVYLDGASRGVATKDQTQTLTNKTIDSANNTLTIDADEATVSNLEVDNLKAGVLDTDISAVSASDDTIPSAKAVKTYVDTQIATVDDAADIAYDNATSGLTATDTQAAIDEVEGRVDDLETLSGVASGSTSLGTFTGTTITDNSTVKTALQELETGLETKATDTKVDEIDTNVNDLITLSGVAENATTLGTFTGSTITDNSTVKTALQELETEVETKADDADLTTHINDTSAHGVTGAVVGTTDTQTITNKTFDDALTLQEIATPANPAAGYKKVYPKSDGKLYTLDDAGNEVAVGSGGGGLDAYVTQDFEALAVASFSTGNNATYRTAGTLDGTLTDETASPIAGARSPKYTAGAASTNDWFEIETVTLDDKQKNAWSGVTLYADMSAFSVDVDFVVYDVTNSTVLTRSGTDILVGGEAKDRYQFAFFIPSTCSQIAYGCHMTNAPVNLESFVIDDVEFSTNPFIYKDLSLKDSITHSGKGSTLVTRATSIEFNLSNITQDGDGLINITNSGSSTLFTAVKDCYVNAALFAAVAASGNRLWVRKNGTSSASDGPQNSGANLRTGVSWNGKLSAGDYIEFRTTDSIVNGSGGGDDVSLSIVASAKSESLITPMDNVAPVRYSSGAGQTITTGSTDIIDFGTQNYDDDGLVTTGASWSYEVPVTGKYTVNASIITAALTASAVNTDAQLRLYKNGSLEVVLDEEHASTTTSKRYSLSGSTTVQLTKGDTLDVRLTNNLGADWVNNASVTRNYIEIERVDKNALGAFPLQPVVCSVYRAAALNHTAGAGVAETLIFDTVTKDTHNAYNTTTGVYTVPVAGDYFVKGQVRFASITDGSKVQSAFNGTTGQIFRDERGSSSTLALTTCAVGVLVNLQVGDEIYYEFLHTDSATEAITANQNYTNMQIYKLP